MVSQSICNNRNSSGLSTEPYLRLALLFQLLGIFPSQLTLPVTSLLSSSTPTRLLPLVHDQKLFQINKRYKEIFSNCPIFLYQLSHSKYGINCVFSDMNPIWMSLMVIVPKILLSKTLSKICMLQHLEAPII